MSAQYEVKIGWERDFDFEGLYDDITDDVKSISFSRGKSDELGKAEVGSCSIVVNNDDAKYTPSYSSSVLYTNLLPKRPVRIRAVQQLVTVSVTKVLAAAGDYAAEDVMSESAGAGTAWTFADVTKIKGGFGYITKAQAICETTALTPMLTLYLFKASPACALNDNVANTATLHADVDNCIGKIDFPALSDLGGDSESLATPSTYGNIPIGFNCAVDSTSIYGVLVTRDAITGEAAGMDMTIVLTVEIPYYDLFYGYIEEIIPHPHLSEQDCIITAVDGLDFLSRHDLSTALYKDTKTGLIHKYILDDALWNEDMRLLDDGQDIVPYWFGQDVKARFAQEEIDDSEQGFSYVDGAGLYHFEDRYHRSTATHQTSQGTFTDTMSNITYSMNPRNVYNIIKSTVTPWEVQVEATLWTLEETPTIPVGETYTVWGEAEISGQSVFVDAWTTLDGTDYTISGTFTIAQTNLAKTIKIVITNTGTTANSVTLLRARGTWYDNLTKSTRKAEDSTSQSAYQKRTLSLDGKYHTDSDSAQSFCNYAIGKYKDPRAEISMTIMNQDDATLTQILSREISDRITVVNNKLGVSADFFIDYMEHNITISGLLHTATYRLADCVNEDFWCLGFSKLGRQTKLAY